MGRPSKQTAEYFPHFVADSRTKFTLEHYWGNDGYAFWFKLLELLCRTDGHAYSCAEIENWEYLLAYMKVEEATAEAILSKLSALGKIDSELWENHRVVWCDRLIEGLSSLYSKRTSVPQKPSFRSENDVSSVVSDAEMGVSGAEMPRSEVKRREVKGSKENISPLPPKGESAAAVPFEKIKQLYNETCKSFPKIKIIDGQRRKAVAARWRTYQNLDVFMELFEKTEASDFMKGNNNKNWHADFDWIIRPTNMAKVLEGKYDNDRMRGGTNCGTGTDCRNTEQTEPRGFKLEGFKRADK